MNFLNIPFDKAAFKIKLAFMLHQWNIAGNFFLKDFGKDKMESVNGIYFGSALTTLWQERFKNCYMDCIDVPDDFNTFVKFMTIGIIQIHSNIKQIHSAGKINTQIIIEVEMLINERVTSLADEVEEFLNTKRDEIKTPNSNG